MQRLFRTNKIEVTCSNCSHLDPGSIKALYKSDMTFSERLYVSLDVDLCRVRLHDSLTNITRKPLLYVRDIVPRACFEGLTRLDKVSGCVLKDFCLQHVSLM